MDTSGLGTGAAVGVTLGLGILLLIAVVNGLVIGALARWLLPGPDPMSYPKTFLFGLGGSLVGTIVGRMINAANWLCFVLSVLGAMALIWFFRRRTPQAAPPPPPPPPAPQPPTTSA